MRQAVAMPPPYDVFNFLNLLGVEISPGLSQAGGDPGEDLVAYLTVRHELIAGTGFLWAPVVITMADALCAFGVNRHWPEGAKSFTTVDCSANFISSAKEGERVTATATPLHTGRTTQIWDARVTNETSGRLMASYRCTQLLLY